VHDVKVYIAGPITGLPDHNRAAFAAAEAWLSAAGCTPVNPHTVAHAHPGRTCPPGERHTEGDETHPYGCWIRADVKALLDCDAVALLPGWSQSRGARHELATAVICSMPVHYLLGAEPAYAEDGALIGSAT
jgi:uncharacterized protein DUF4406